LPWLIGTDPGATCDIKGAARGYFARAGGRNRASQSDSGAPALTLANRE